METTAFTKVIVNSAARAGGALTFFRSFAAGFAFGRIRVRAVAACIAGASAALASGSLSRAEDDPPPGAHAGPASDLSRGPLRISDNGRFLVTADGAPFFYLSDTNWELFTRARREDAETLLEKRRSQGFTVIFGPVTGILDGLYFKKPLRVPNVYGDLPFIAADVTKPAVTPGADPDDAQEYDYWDHVDAILDIAESKGLYVGILPAWHDHYRAGLVNPSNARAYGRFLGRRFGQRRNIFWVLGGDTMPEEEPTAAQRLRRAADDFKSGRLGDGQSGRIDAQTFSELAKGLEEGEAAAHLKTFHPRGGGSSSRFFHGSDWLDFNMIQSGHRAYDTPNYEMISADYARIPVKPTMDAENRYEDHSVNYKPANGWFGAYDNRQAAYWGLFAGGHGHTYGNRGVWQMFEDGRPAYGDLRYKWPEAMDLPGAWDMLHVRRLMTSRPVLDRAPAQELIVGGAGAGLDRLLATRGRSYAFIYTANGRVISPDLKQLGAKEIVAWWYDPRTGRADRIGLFDGENASYRFKPPGETARGNDWILVLDDAAEKFPPPGASAFD